MSSLAAIARLTIGTEKPNHFPATFLLGGDSDLILQ
jgi:hypothetical protein